MAADEHLRPGRPRLLRAINERARARAPARPAAPPRAPSWRAATGALQADRRRRRSANLSAPGWSARGRPAAPASAGARALLYELDPTAAHVAGVDVGRAWVRVAVADLGGRGRRAPRRAQPRAQRRRAGRAVRALAHEVAAEAGLAWDDVVHTVVGSPGVFDPATGRLRYAPNLPGWGRPGPGRRAARAR